MVSRSWRRSWDLIFLAFRQFLDFNYSKNKIFKKNCYENLRKRNSRQKFFSPRINSSRRRKVEHWFWIILWAAWLLTKLKAYVPVFYSTTQSYDRIMKAYISTVNIILSQVSVIYVPNISSDSVDRSPQIS
jgi:hypothetical protein